MDFISDSQLWEYGVESVVTWG